MSDKQSSALLSGSASSSAILLKLILNNLENTNFIQKIVHQTKYDN